MLRIKQPVYEPHMMLSRNTPFTILFHLMPLPKQVSGHSAVKHSASDLVLDSLAFGQRCLTAHTILQNSVAFWYLLLIDITAQNV